MDYHIFYEEETGRMVPLEYDGNTVLNNQNLDWPPFYNSNDANYPLLYRLLQIDELRQRYLAHYRVILEELNPENSHPQILYWHNFITDLVESDPNSIYPFGQFNYETDLLMDAMADRYDFLSNAPEVNVVPPVINSVVMESAEGVWTSPAPNLSATVIATSDDDLAGINLYYSMGVNGMFTKVEMEAGSSGEYSALIPYASVGTVIRFYVEAISSNSLGTRSYGLLEQSTIPTITPLILLKLNRLRLR